MKVNELKFAEGSCGACAWLPSWRLSYSVLFVPLSLQRKLPADSRVLEDSELVYTVSAQEYWQQALLTEEETGNLYIYIFSSQSLQFSGLSLALWISRSRTFCATLLVCHSFYTYEQLHACFSLHCCGAWDHNSFLLQILRWVVISLVFALRVLAHPGTGRNSIHGMLFLWGGVWG